MTMKNIGRYEVQWELGRGGMASVYLALDPAINRQVAIKVMSSALSADPEFAERFEREAQVIGSLEHPYIVPVYDFGEQDGQQYIVMRYMPGGALNRVIRREGKMSPKEVGAVMLRMAGALDYSHKHGVIHRDFKPENILFDQRDDSFLADFGIVRILTSSGALTSGTIAGTAAYMSPEQINADDNVDGRTDVYAMGVTIFEMMSGGKTPYNDRQPTRLMVKHIKDPIPNILDFNADLPAGATDVIMKALAKNPDDRYQTAQELAEAVLQLDGTRLSKRASRRLTADDVEAMFDTISDEDEDQDKD